ncbi:hypothetical protein KU710_23810, partial [Salmonella enterica subsp. enterica serovar Give]|nr:hypothetical protein [Salmonella enterica subsp. enterica serovar Give]
AGGDIRQQLRRFYRTADFNDSFCHAAQSWQRIIQPWRIDGGVMKTKGSLYGGTWQMDVPELKLTGNVKQNSVNVNGTLKGNS